MNGFQRNSPNVGSAGQSQRSHVPQTSTNYSSGGSAGAGLTYNAGPPSSTTLKAWADQQTFLDIYMVNAFYLGTGQRSQYFMSFWKTATCFGLQFVGIWLLFNDQWEAYNDTNQTCAVSITGDVALVGYFFATYITIFCSEQIRTLNRYGMYGWGEGQPEFVNSLWVGIGLWTNLFSLFLSWFVSCMIIYTSPDILNMVLNSVAVTFMLTLDDEIIGESDYNRIKDWDERNGSACRAVDGLFSKLGGLLLKIWPCWQRRFVCPLKAGYRCQSCTADCCDLLLCPFMIVIPFVVLFCYPYDDQICLYEGFEEELCGL